MNASMLFWMNREWSVEPSEVESQSLIAIFVHRMKTIRGLGGSAIHQVPDILARGWQDQTNRTTGLIELLHIVRKLNT